MEDYEKVIKGLECCEGHHIGKSCGNCPYNDFDTDNPNQFECVEYMVRDALELLKEQKEDATIMQRCREGSTVKYLGKGVIVLNYQWWIETLKRKGEFSPVPSMDDMQ